MTPLLAYVMVAQAQHQKHTICRGFWLSNRTPKHHPSSLFFLSFFFHLFFATVSVLRLFDLVDVLTSTWPPAFVKKYKNVFYDNNNSARLRCCLLPHDTVPNNELLLLYILQTYLMPAVENYPLQKKL